MRKFTTEHTVYTFDELSDEAKEYALEKMRESEQEFGFHFLSDDMTEHLTEVLLPEAKIKYSPENLKVYYSLSYCQGDGAMFEGVVKWRGYEVAIKQSGHYYHYNSKTFYIETRHGNEAKQSVYDQFNEIYVDICQKLARYGYDQIEYTLSDEALKETIEANEYEFYENGRMA